MKSPVLLSAGTFRGQFMFTGSGPFGLLPVNIKDMKSDENQSSCLLLL